MKRIPIGCGSECEVYDIGGGMCYKRYHTQAAVGIAYDNAVKAADADIGPEVYRKGRKGYTTEIVELYGFCKHCGDNYFDICCEICDEFIDEIGRKKYYEMIAVAVKIFGKTAVNDLHNDNIGLKDGKPIMIDFGICSGLNLKLLAEYV